MGSWFRSIRLNLFWIRKFYKWAGWLGNSGMYFPFYRFVLRKIPVPFIFKLAFVYENYLHHRGRHCRTWAIRQQSGSGFPFTSASKNNFSDFHISQGLYWESPSLSPYPLLVEGRIETWFPSAVPPEHCCSDHWCHARRSFDHLNPSLMLTIRAEDHG